MSTRSPYFLLSSIIVLFALSLPVSAEKIKASFDCAKASNTVERGICASSDLRYQDAQLAKVYQRVRQQKGQDKKQLKKTQLKWMRSRKECVESGEIKESCLIKKYQKRSAYLASLISHDSAKKVKKGPLKVLRVSPRGEVASSAKQIVVTFDRPMVPIGEMALAADAKPVTITPALPCEWRWYNTSSLSCRLKNSTKLAESTAYEVLVPAGFKSFTGEVLSKEYRSRFETQRPRVNSRVYLYSWFSPERPIHRIYFTHPVSAETVEEFFEYRVGDQVVPVRVVPAIDSFPVPEDLALPGENIALGYRPEHQNKKEMEELEGDFYVRAERNWLIIPREPLRKTPAMLERERKALADWPALKSKRLKTRYRKRELPQEERATLVVKPGIFTKDGKLPGKQNGVILAFDLLPEFRFLGTACDPEYDTGWRDTLFLHVDTLQLDDPQKSVNAQCSPREKASLVFSSPTFKGSVQQGVEFTPGLNQGDKSLLPWKDYRNRLKSSSNFQLGDTFDFRLPIRFLAWQQYEINLDSSKVTDIFGRSLDQDYQAFLKTKHRTSVLWPKYRQGVLEHDLDSEMGGWFRNVSQLNFDYRGLVATDDGFAVLKPAGDVSTGKSSTHRYVQKLDGEITDARYFQAIDYRGLLQGKSGVISGKLSADKLFDEPLEARNRTFFVQVSTLSVFAKAADFGAMAWVTDTNSGQPIENARVELVKHEKSHIDEDITAVTPLGRIAYTDKDGIARFDDKKLAEQGNYSFVVTFKDQIAQLPLSYEFSANSRSTHYNQYLKAWGFTAQGVYKVGDKVEYKLFLRDEDDKQLVAAPNFLVDLKVYSPMGVKVHQRKGLRLNDFGAIDGEFTVPEGSAVGWYYTKLTAHFGENDSRTFHPVNFLVADFTPSSFKVSADLKQARVGNNQTLDFVTHANLLSGGPYKNAKLRVQGNFIPKPFRAPQGSSFRDFVFHERDNERYRDNQRFINEKHQLDGEGKFSKGYTLALGRTDYGRLVVEAAVQDDRGKNIAASASAIYSGSDRWVGLKARDWFAEQGKPTQFDVVVVDADGRPFDGASTTVDIYHRETIRAKVKGAGDHYEDHYETRWTKRHSCKVRIKGGSEGCEFTPENAGRYRIVAEATNVDGDTVRAQISSWVTGSGYVSWRTDKSKTLEIIPVSDAKNVGDVARYLVKNPYPGSKALISVERYGVLDSWVEEFEGGLPLVEIPIKKTYTPGFYLSVSVFSPRTGERPEPGKVDLGKPEIRTGVIRTDVADPYHQLHTEVTTDKTAYKPGDMVQAKVKISGNELEFPHATELTIVAIDEAVLMLNNKGQDYYDIYKGFYALKGRAVHDYSLLRQLVERLKLEKKGTTPGGDGGEEELGTMRGLFKYIAYWQPALVTNDGTAEFEFKLPDNLTQWRLFAISADKAHRLGTGNTTFRVSRPLEIQPAMPNQLTQGDKFTARFTLMNRTKHTQTVDVRIEANGAIETEKGSPAIKTERVELPPFERVPVTMALDTADAGEIAFTIKAANDAISDQLSHSVPVLKRKSLVSAANYGTTTQNKVLETVRFPDAMYENVGALSVDLFSSVMGELDGAFDYLRTYPHLCWEQRLSKALAAANYVELQGRTKVEWPEAKSVVQEMIKSAPAFQAPSGGMAFFTPTNERVNPYLTTYTLIGINRLKALGYQIPEAFEKALVGYVKKFVRKDIYPDYFHSNVVASVRAVALKGLVEAGQATASDVDRFRSQLPQMSLFAKAHYLEAALGVDDEEAVLDTLDRLLSTTDQTAGKFQFIEAKEDAYRYIASSRSRTNCAILSALLKVEAMSEHRGLVAEIPYKLMRGISQQRQAKAHWRNTQENLFCLKAFNEYAEIYERDKPSFSVAVKENETLLGEAAFDNFSAKVERVSRQVKSGDAGSEAKVAIEKQGEGRLYYATRLSYAPHESDAKPVNAGMEVAREYYVQRGDDWQQIASPMQLKRGDLLRVDLFVNINAPRHFVVVSDPVPGGVEPVNRDLATTSQNDADIAQWPRSRFSRWHSLSDWIFFGAEYWSFYHQEVRHDTVNFYADYLPGGNYYLSYTAQVIADGEFTVMPTKAEEMYDPDVFGLSMPAAMQVGEENNGKAAQ